MTPVMERCACSWPIAECLEHSPPRAPVDDADGLAQPSAAVNSLAVWVGLGVMAWGVVGLVAWGLWEIGRGIIRVVS